MPPLGPGSALEPEHCRRRQELFAAILSHIGLARGCVLATDRSEAVLPERAGQFDLVGSPRLA
jgi:hypothetical protein